MRNRDIKCTLQWDPRLLSLGPLHLSQPSPSLLPALSPPLTMILVGDERMLWGKLRTSLKLHALVFSSARGGRCHFPYSEAVRIE